ncbi:MAG: hypothetical protein J0J15_05495 [Mesorhizobium sp.]|nr:hypothetical protein [Mesorhizobium sp.]
MSDLTHLTISAARATVVRISGWANAALTSVEAPLICPTTLRPEPFSGRYWRLSAFTWK